MATEIRAPAVFNALVGVSMPEAVAESTTFMRIETSVSFISLARRAPEHSVSGTRWHASRTDA
jgi:hypothetical protein